MKRKIAIAAAIIVLAAVLLTAFNGGDEYTPAEDEIVLHIKMNTDDDVGLLVFDYSADGSDYSGGISNADKSLIKRDSDNIVVWTKRELNAASDAVEMSMRLRVITEYAQPNYENVYPEEITRYTEPISWKARFGEEYSIIVTGDKINGYRAVPDQTPRP